MRKLRVLFALVAALGLGMTTTACVASPVGPECDEAACYDMGPNNYDMGPNNYDMGPNN